MIDSTTGVQRFDKRPISARLGLGTAQVGMPYGATNRHPPPDSAELGALLDLAADAGIAWIDTAPAYGDAEVRLGEHLGRHASFRIITKVGPLADIPVGRAGRAVRESVERSIGRLRRESVDLLLLHRVSDLSRADSAELLAALTALKADRLVARVGVSLYEPSELQAVLDGKLFEVVQAPINPLDPRFVSQAVLRDLERHGIVLHARSLFLQGLLVTPPADLPGFARHHPALSAWSSWLGSQVSPIAACLRLVLACPAIECAIVGAATATQLREIVEAASTTGDLPAFQSLEADPVLIDPRRWPPRPVD